MSSCKHCPHPEWAHNTITGKCEAAIYGKRLEYKETRIEELGGLLHVSETYEVLGSCHCPNN